MTATFKRFGRSARWVVVALLIVIPGTALLLPAVIWWLHRKGEARAATFEPPAAPVELPSQPYRAGIVQK